MQGGKITEIAKRARRAQLSSLLAKTPCGVILEGDFKSDAARKGFLKEVLQAGCLGLSNAKSLVRLTSERRKTGNHLRPHSKCSSLSRPMETAP